MSIKDQIKIIKPTFQNGKFEAIGIEDKIPKEELKLYLDQCPNAFITGIFIFGKFVAHPFSSEHEALYWISIGHSYHLWHLIYPVNYETQD